MMKPPGVARAIMRIVCAQDTRDFLLDDLDEEFRSRASRNAAAARWWYREQVVRSIGPQMWHRMFHMKRVQPARTRAMRLDIADDLKHAVRVAWRSPWITATIVATMTVGIGIATSAFSIMNGMLMKPLPFAESSRVVQIGVTFPDGRAIDYVVYPDLLDYADRVKGYADVAAFSAGTSSFVSDAGARVVTTNSVTEPYARVFSWRTAAGRLFEPGDFVAAGTPAALVTHAFWSQYLNKDSTIVGRSINVGGRPVTVVGVLAASDYHYPPGRADIYFPLYVPPTPGRGIMGRMCHCVSAVARLRDGQSIDGIRNATRAVHKQIVSDFAANNVATVPNVIPLKDAVVGSSSAVMWLLSAAVVAVLLLACVNIGNLLLGRSYARSREFAVRAALGSGTMRLTRQLVAESVVVAAIGAVPGVLIAPLITRAFAALYPDGLPRLDEMRLDPLVVTAAAAITLVSAIVGAMPTIRRAMSPDLARSLRDAGRMGTSRGQRRAANVVILTQVAVSVALLFAAGTLVQTLRRLNRVDTGFQTSNLLTFRVTAPGAQYQTAEALEDFFGRLQKSIAAMPGVARVASTSFLPFGAQQFIDIYYDDEHGDRGAANPAAFVASVDSEYLPTLGAQLIAGRTFGAGDLANAPPVAVVNETVAKTLFPDGNAVGHYITSGHVHNIQIVGVVRDIHTRSLWEKAESQIFMPFLQRQQRARFVIVRGDAGVAALRPAIERELRQLDPRIPIANTATMNELLASAVAPQRFRATLVGVLGVIAICLASLGIYSVVAYGVNRQTREIGLRMALGEMRLQVQRRVVWSALRITMIGVVPGLGLAIIEARWMARFVVGAGVYDISLLLLAVFAPVMVALLAAYVPALRASQVDPLVALRNE